MFLWWILFLLQELERPEELVPCLLQIQISDHREQTNKKICTLSIDLLAQTVLSYRLVVLVGCTTVPHYLVNLLLTEAHLFAKQRHGRRFMMLFHDASLQTGCLFVPCKGLVRLLLRL